MRGKLPYRFLGHVGKRITPADAGKTIRGVLPYNQHRDHPRGCGENEWCFTFGINNIGSPPRMRGKLNAMTTFKMWQRITPADAGKTPRKTWTSLQSPDHPRGCGENFGACQHQAMSAGSPPRMRGKPYGGGLIFLLRRITPADAGKTVKNGFLAGRTADHPRGCGENAHRCKS